MVVYHSNCDVDLIGIQIGGGADRIESGLQQRQLAVEKGL